MMDTIGDFMKYLSTILLLAQVILLSSCETDGGGSSTVAGLSCVYEGEAQSSCVNINRNFGTDTEIKDVCEEDLGFISNTECPKVLNGLNSDGLCVVNLQDNEQEGFFVSSRRYNNDTPLEKEANCVDLNSDQWIADEN